MMFLFSRDEPLFPTLSRVLNWIAQGIIMIWISSAILLLVSIVMLFVILTFVPDHKQLEARLTAARTTLASIRTALDAFDVDLNCYPTAAEGLAVLCQAPPGSQAALWRGPYLDKLPIDPWDHPYQYAAPSSTPGRVYDVASAGPDGRFGSSDDISIDSLTWDEIVRTRLRILSLTKALDAFRANVGRYPTAAEGLNALYTCPPSVAPAKWKAAYAHQDTNDAWKTPIRYTAPAMPSGKDFTLLSAGPDAEFGTSDDVAPGWTDLDDECGIRLTK